MTRINVVPVNCLSDKHLVAEYRELPRVFGLAAKTGLKAQIPEQYVNGTGHVTFFYDKLAWCERRCKELIAEMRRRGFNASFEGDFSEQRASIPAELWGHWQVTEQAIAANMERLMEKDQDHYAERTEPKTHSQWAGCRLKPLVDANPRRVNTHGWRSLNIILAEPGLTTEEYLKKGGRLVDLRWDLKKRHVRAVQPPRQI